MFVVVAEQNEHYYGDYFILLQSFFIVISYKVLVFSPSPYGTLMTQIKQITTDFQKLKTDSYKLLMYHSHATRNPSFIEN